MQGEDTGAERTAGRADLKIILQDIADCLEDDLLVIDDEYRIRFANSAVRGKLPQGAGFSIGGLCYKVLHERDTPCSAPLWDCPLRKVIESGSMTTVVHPIHMLGAERHIKVTAFLVQDRQSNRRGIIELRRDVTEERELEAKVLRRHHQILVLRHISSAVSGLSDLDATLRLALDSVLEITNGAVGGILVFDKETEKLHYRVQRGLSPRYAEGMRLSIGEGIAGKVAQSGETILLIDISKDPRAVHPDLISTEGLRGFASLPIKVKGKTIGVLNIASHMAWRFGEDDISLLNSVADYLGTTIEQARLYDHLTKAEERLRTLLQHALTAQEQERKRIAGELHDETAQAITSLTLSLQAIIGLAEMKGFGDTAFIDRLKATQAYAVHAGNEIVRLMKELRPTLLDELGLPAAIHRHAKDTLKARGVNLSVEFKGMEQRLPPEVEVTLFRIAQGLVGNILEHSEAKNASIKLECDANQCVLVIKDDGKGFDVSKVTRVDPSGRGAGLFTTKERVRLIGGICHIESQPGQGTCHTVKIPLIRDIADEENKSASS
jgi:signal transduction histidine kinase